MDLANLPAWTALAVALGAGIASFLSPCVAPLLPGYVAFVTGDATDRGALGRATGFVLGFILLFALLGASAAAVSRDLTEHREALERGSGLLVALFGLAMAFDRSLVPHRVATALQRRSNRIAAPVSALAAIPVGAAFAIAWTPCIGPALSAILALAAGESRPAWGAILLVVYGVGLGIPFILGALALDRVGGISRALRRHAPTIRIVGGVILVCVGTAIATGRFGDLTGRLARLAPGWLG